MSITVEKRNIKYEYDYLNEIYNVQLKDGTYPFLIEFKFISRGSQYTIIKDIRIDYQLEGIQQYYIEFDAQLSVPSTSVSKSIDIQYQKDWEKRDFEMKITSMLSDGITNQLAQSDWDIFLILHPYENSGLIYACIFVPIGGLVLIGAFSLPIMKKRRKKV